MVDGYYLPISRSQILAVPNLASHIYVMEETNEKRLYHLRDHL